MRIRTAVTNQDNLDLKNPKTYLFNNQTPVKSHSPTYLITHLHLDLHLKCQGLSLIKDRLQHRILKKGLKHLNNKV